MSLYDYYQKHILRRYSCIYSSIRIWHQPHTHSFLHSFIYLIHLQIRRWIMICSFSYCQILLVSDLLSTSIGRYRVQVCIGRYRVQVLKATMITIISQKYKRKPSKAYANLYTIHMCNFDYFTWCNFVCLISSNRPFPIDLIELCEAIISIRSVLLLVRFVVAFSIITFSIIIFPLYHSVSLALIMEYFFDSHVVILNDKFTDVVACSDAVSNLVFSNHRTKQ